MLFRDNVTNEVDLAARTATHAIFGDDITPLKVAFQPDGSPIVLGIVNAPFGQTNRTLTVHRLQRDESPAGLLDARSLVKERDGSYRFRVYWRDEDGVDAATLGDDNVRILLPDGTSRRARLVKLEQIGGGKVVVATYLVTSPDGRWDAAANGRYQVRVERKSVRDTLGNPAGKRVIGGFVVQIADAVSPTALPAAPSPGTPGEGWGEGSRSARATQPPRQSRRTFTLPAPRVPGEGKGSDGATIDDLLA